VEETAEALSVLPNGMRDWKLARAWLGIELRKRIESGQIDDRGSDLL
jgi:hypothetical protein